MAIIAPEINPQPISDVRIQSPTTPETFGGGAGLEAEGQQIQKIAADTGEIAGLEKIRAIQTAAQEGTAKLAEIHTKLLYDPNNGVLASRGTNAMAARDKAWKDYQQSANDISNGLHDPMAKGIFNKEAIAMGDAFTKTAMAHETQQMREHDDNTFKALVSNMTNIGAMAYGDPMQRKLTLGIIDDHTMQYARRNGLDPDETSNLRSNINSNYHQQTISMMLNNGQAEMAKQYFSENRDDINPKEQERITDMITDGSVKGQSQSSAQQILKAHPGSEENALAAADKIKDPAVQEMTRQLVSRQFQENRQARKNDQEQTFFDVGQKIKKAGLTDPTDIAQAITPSEKAGMSNEQYRAILKSGGETITSPSKWLDFRQALKDGSLAGISNADFQSKYLQYFDPSDKKQAINEWTTAQKGGPKEKSYRSAAQMTDDALINNGLIRATKRQENDVRFQRAFANTVNRDLDMQQDSLGRPLKPEEIQTVIDKNIIKATETQSDHWWNRPAVPLESIPEPDKLHIVELARSIGGIANRHNIEKAYTLHKQGKSDDDIKKMLK